MARALQLAYVPFMLVAIDGAAIALVAAGATAWLPILLLGAIVLSFAVERAIPYEPDWNRSRGDVRRDVAHAIVNELATVAALLLLPAIASIATVTDVWPTGWPFVVQVLASLLVLDAGITLAHYASHRVALLWRFHAVHHSVKRFYGFNGLMKHPLHQLVELTAGVLPLVLVGLPVDVAIALGACVVVQLLLQHSNADYRAGVLGRILALNQAHRFHHQQWPGLGDVNFGLVTTLWDRLLGTYAFDPAKRFTSDDLGIGSRPGFPPGYVAQLADPFRRPDRASGSLP